MAEWNSLIVSAVVVYTISSLRTITLVYKIKIIFVNLIKKIYFFTLLAIDLFNVKYTLKKFRAATKKLGSFMIFVIFAHSFTDK